MNTEESEADSVGASKQNDMKACFCAGYAPSLVNFRWQLMKSIASLGYKILGVAPENDRDVISRFEREGFRYLPVSMARSGASILGDYQYLRALRRLMVDERPNHVFCYTIKPVIFGALAAKSAKVPRVYAMITGLGYVFTGDGGVKKLLLRGVVSFLLKRALRSCDGLFFQNPDDEAELRSRGLIPRDLAVFQVAGSGIDLERFPRVPPRVLKSGERVKFLLIARMLVDKGIREFAEATKAIKDGQCLATLVGPLDPNPAALQREEIDLWTTDGQIRYVPGADDVRPFLSDCHVYVLPSYREGTPRTVLEAMATGRPIITTDAPGCRETVPLTEKGKRQKAAGDLVMEGENGFLVCVRDAVALEQAMRRFIEEPELIERMGMRSREIAEEKYDVHEVNEVMIEAMGLNEKGN